MTEQEMHTVDLLNELFALEKRSLLPRLAEMRNFVSQASARDAAQLERMAADELEHQTWLAEAIERCGGGVVPAAADLTTANLHYLELRAVVPQVVRSVESMVQVYRQIGVEASALTPEAGQIVALIAGRHQSHLEQLKNLESPPTPA